MKVNYAATKPAVSAIRDPKAEFPGGVVNDVHAPKVPWTKEALRAEIRSLADEMKPSRPEHGSGMRGGVVSVGTKPLSTAAADARAVLRVLAEDEANETRR